MHSYSIRRIVCSAVIAALVWQAPVIGSARAAMVTTEAVLQTERKPIAGADAAGRERLLAFLRRQDVRAQLTALGVNPAEAEARVASLSDEEVAVMVGRLDNLPAGGNSSSGYLEMAGLVVILPIVVLGIIAVGIVSLIAASAANKSGGTSKSPSDSAPVEQPTTDDQGAQAKSSEPTQQFASEPERQAWFEAEREAIKQAITDYYDMGGYTEDFPGSVNGAQLDRMTNMSLRTASGDRFEVEARYIAVAIWDNAANDRTSRFILRKENDTYQVIGMRSLRENS